MTSRCAACPGEPFQPVMGDGLRPAQVMLIGAGPSKVENRTGKPYTGLAGEELNETYLPLAGLRREDVWIDNCRACYDGLDKTPTTLACLTCALHHLPETLDAVRPEVVVLMGGAAQGVSDTRVRLEMHRGRPMRTRLLGGRYECWVWPSYEPALGMRETSRMTQLCEDFKHLGQWMRGEWKATEANGRPHRYE